MKSIRINIQKLIVAAVLALAATVAAHAGPISKGGFVISKPGKYFLTKNINALVPAGYNAPFGILIQTSDVELDLAGFSIGPTNDVGIGIYLVDGVKQVRVHNGRIQGVQTAVLSAVNKKIKSCIFERLQIGDCSNNGIEIWGSENVIRTCTLSNVASQQHGIVVHTTLARFNEISDCTISSDIVGSTGINSSLTNGLIVRRCVVQSFEEGIRVTAQCKLMDNLTLNCGTGITGNPVLVGNNN